jgi:putative component of toxin-antitoxin plasmid stabilization module
MEDVGDVLYAEGISELRYIKGACNGIYTRGRNKVIYIEFASCRRSVLLITKNRLAYALSKIDTG